ncbi:hypothetical protein BJV82DRAFT_159346 [Fennellomyces sp. T-0311]|nr:hypothetical protein BJV82DRAFT_159346 [Fennellomyces sp. T-0311]
MRSTHPSTSPLHCLPTAHLSSALPQAWLWTPTVTWTFDSLFVVVCAFSPSKKKGSCGSIICSQLATTVRAQREQAKAPFFLFYLLPNLVVNAVPFLGVNGNAVFPSMPF